MTGPTPDKILDEVAAEGERAARVHGEPGDRTGLEWLAILAEGLEWLAILAEGLGEAATEVTRGEVPPVDGDRAGYRRRLRAELVQVASVATRWVMAIDRGEGTR